MPRFHKKPIVIEARQFDGSRKAIEDIVAWAGGRFQFREKPTEDRRALIPQIVIPTLEGDSIASVGDWVVCGVNGEFYPCKDEIFRKTYEPVEAEDAR